MTSEDILNSKQVFSTSEAAGILGVHTSTVVLWCNTGKLKFHRIGSKCKKRYITRASIIEFILALDGIRIDPHTAVIGETKELISNVRLMLLELRRRPDFNMESIRDVIT